MKGIIKSISLDRIKRCNSKHFTVCFRLPESYPVFLAQFFKLCHDTISDAWSTWTKAESILVIHTRKMKCFLYPLPMVGTNLWKKGEPVRWKKSHILHIDNPSLLSPSPTADRKCCENLFIKNWFIKKTFVINVNQKDNVFNLDTNIQIKQAVANIIWRVI